MSNSQGRTAESLRVAGDIEYETLVRMQHKQNVLWKKKIALLSVVVAAVAIISAFLNEPPWDLPALPLIALAVLLIGGLSPTLTNIFRNARQKEIRLESGSEDLDQEKLLDLRWRINRVARIRLDRAISLEVKQYIRWLFVVLASILLCISLLIVHFIQRQGEDNGRQDTPDSPPAATAPAS